MADPKGFLTTPRETAPTRPVEEHRERTGSKVAARLLDDWQASLNKIVKVMPHDYKRALAELADAEGRQFEDAESTGGEGFMATERAA